MISFKKLEDILEITIKWEEQMKDLYDVAELGLKTKDSKELLIFLKESHKKHLHILKKLNVKDYGPDEWINFTADFDAVHQIPQHNISKDSTIEEIFSKVRSYEESLQSVYQRVSEHTVSVSQTELFTSLSVMKRNQITTVKDFMESYFNPNLG
jgi:rubrerythrin